MGPYSITRRLIKILREKNIKVYDEYLYVHMLKVKGSKEKAYLFADRIIDKYKKEVSL